MAQSYDLEFLLMLRRFATLKLNSFTGPYALTRVYFFKIRCLPSNPLLTFMIGHLPHGCFLLSRAMIRKRACLLGPKEVTGRELPCNIGTLYKPTQYVTLTWPYILYDDTEPLSSFLLHSPKTRHPETDATFGSTC